MSALDAARAALAGERAWVVGGAVRDALLGRATSDVDVAVDGDPKRAARALARAVRGAGFPLSDAFGGWRVVGPERAWHVDLLPLQGGDILADLARRDFTINAMAQPLDGEGGEPIDPHGGRADLAARRLRTVAAGALADDPLRTLRAVRFAVELGLEIEPATAAAVAANAPALAGVAAERTFAELKRVIAADAVRHGLELMDALGLTAVVLPELLATRGVEQSVYHHLDVHGHTLAVLDAVIALQRASPAPSPSEPPGDLTAPPAAPPPGGLTAPPAAPPLGGLTAPGAAPPLGDLAAPVAALLAEPLSDDLTRGTAMRFAALLHDAAKPQTRAVSGEGRVTFFGHDNAGAQLARDVLARLRTSQKLRDYVATLVARHLDLGFLVHRRPLDRRTIWRYLRAGAPYAADLTAFTVADRLATRGRNAEAAIAAHLEVARAMLAAAFAEREQGEPPPLLRGDELIAELGIAPGPQLGAILAQLAEDRYAGAVVTRADALARARELAAR